MVSSTAADVLATIAVESPWFPTRHAQRLGIDRQVLDAPIGDLLQAQLIEARDWVKDLGQGFVLTDVGRRVAADLSLLPRILSGQPAPEPAEPLPPTVYDRGERARQAYYEPRRPIITQLLVVITLAVFAVGFVLSRRDGAGGFSYLAGQDAVTAQRLGAVSGDTLVRGQWWRLETANFVHFGYLHLLLNLASLGVVGALAENLWGRWRYALIYMVAGLAGCSLAMMLRPLSLVAGASCAIWGVMASLGVWIVQYRQHFESDIMNDFARRIGLAIVLNGVFSFLPNVSWEGHLGGGIGGIIMAIALDWIRPGYRRRTRAGIAASLMIPVAIVGLLWVVALRSTAWRPLIERETLRQRLDQHREYLHALQPELDAISPNVALTLIKDIQKAVRLKNYTRYLALEARVSDLKEQAVMMRKKIEALPVTPRGAEDVPTKALEYDHLFDQYADLLLHYLREELDDPSAIPAAKHKLDDAWTALHTIPWP